MKSLAYLPERGVIEVTGEDARKYLQGLVSNDLDLVSPTRAIWAALLTPQGKWLADFFIMQDGARLLIDCERSQAQELVRRFGRFTLRSRVQFREASDEFFVHVAWGNGAAPTAELPGFADPRLENAGWRFLAPARHETSADASDWDRWRLSLGLPDGSRDLEAEKTILLEAGFDELNGISWTKGCYLGQELTARTKYRGLVKRRLVPVTTTQSLPPPGTPISAAGREVGFMRSANQNAGLAIMRIDALNSDLMAGDAILTPRIPIWMTLAA
jgi:folate-binding protein YgfZ